MTKKYLDDSGYTYTINKLKSMIQDVKTSDTLPIGSIVAYGSATPPNNWLICDGSAVSRTIYADLFSVIGTTYGAGDGSTTFNLPDYRDRVPVGLDANDSDFNVLGKTLGEKKHTLTIDEMPAHNHRVATDQSGTGQYWTLKTFNEERQKTAGYSTTSTGGGQPHNIIQPSIVTNYIIKAYQVVAAPGTVKNEYTESDKHVYSTNYVNDKLAGIIESGSNVNGYYTKFNDGTFICYGMYHSNNSIQGGSYIDEMINLPVETSNTNYMIFTNIAGATSNWASLNISIHSRTQSGFTLTVFNTSNSKAAAPYFTWQIIGRWK